MRAREQLLGVKGIVLIILCAAATSLPAATVQVEDIQLPIPFSWWYDIDGHYFHITNTSTSAAVLRTLGAPAYDYGISAVINISYSGLDEDLSVGGVAHGTFFGGATLTVEGSLWDLETEIYYVENDTILVAQMTAGVWELREDGYDNFDGSVYFTPINGGLYAGIEVAGGDILTIGNFRADLSFNQSGPGDVDDFSSQSIMGFGNTIQITAIPEPTLALLLGFGSLLIYRKRNNRKRNK